MYYCLVFDCYQFSIKIVERSLKNHFDTEFSDSNSIKTSLDLIKYQGRIVCIKFHVGQQFQ